MQQPGDRRVNSDAEESASVPLKLTGRAAAPVSADRRPNAAATMCRSGNLLHEFAPAGEILDVAEAIVRVFHRLGDREHKHQNRMKFLIKALGWERYRDEYERERERIRVEGGAKLPFSPSVEHAPNGARGPAPSAADVATRAASSTVRGPGVWGTIRGLGSFANQSPNDALLLLQSFMAVTTVVGITIGAAVAERTLVVVGEHCEIGGVVQ